MGFRKNVLGAIGVSLLVCGCADDPVSSNNSTTSSIVGNWGGSMEQTDTSGGSVSMDLSLSFTEDKKVNETMLVKQIIDDTNNDGKLDTLDQAKVTAFFTALGGTNPMVFSGAYNIEGNRLIITVQNGDSVQTDTSEYKITGNTLKMRVDGTEVSFQRK